MQGVRQSCGPEEPPPAWRNPGAEAETKFRHTLTAIEQSTGQGRDFR
jgi:hypothetical protein